MKLSLLLSSLIIFIFNTHSKGQDCSLDGLFTSNNSLKWKEDSLGIKGTRLTLFHLIENNVDSLINEPEQCILQLLGKPSLIYNNGSKRWLYLISEYRTNEFYLDFSILDGKVMDITW